MTAQEVIKSFMAKLATHGYAYSDSVGTNMLDSSVRASSRFSSFQDVIDAMEADQVAAEKKAVEEVLGSDYAGKLISDVDLDILSASAFTYNDVYKKSNIYVGDGYEYSSSYTLTVENVLTERKAYIFLEDYCGIILPIKYWAYNSSWTSWGKDGLSGNDDTGAITGSDAGGDEVKTASSVVPEEFINTYIAETSIAQNIITNDRDWIIQATAYNDTITSNGADSIDAGAGNDSIIVNADGATVTSGDGEDVITISESVCDITLSDLNSDDVLTISGTFEVASAQIEDTLLVITDKTGTRKIRLGDFETAKSAKINSTTIGDWLTDSGIDFDDLKTKNYSDGKVLSDASDEENSFVTVNLANVSTSAAADVTIDGEIVGSLSSTFPNASTFTRNGLTIHLLGETSTASDDPDNITAKTLDELTDDEKTVVAGLFKWWAKECLKLNEESYGINFVSSTTMIKDIGLYFYSSKSSGKSAAVWNWQHNTTDGTATKLLLSINMVSRSGISADNMDALDRLIAHEFTHAVMATNINYFNALPKFIKEGMAELTHGIDDQRTLRIFEIAVDDTRLANVLDGTDTTTNAYAGGYMFLRYFAKQAAAETLPAFGEITAYVNLDGDGNYYIGGNSTSEIASTSGEIKIGGVSNGVYTLENIGVHQIIDNANNLKIVGLTVNDTLQGSDAADIIETAEGSFIQTGAGDDSIKLSGQFATLETGADNDTVNVVDGSHHLINLGDGDNLVTIQNTYSYSNTITGGAGSDSVWSGWASKSSIDLGGGDDSVHFGGTSNTISAGAGNDTIKFRYSNQNENLVDLGADDDKITVFGGANTIIGGAGNDDIYENSTLGNYFAFNSYFGEDTIRGFTANDTILIAKTFEASQDGSAITVTKNGKLKGVINLQDFSDAVNIVSGRILEDAAESKEIINNIDATLITGTADPDTISNSGDSVTISGGAGDDSIENSGSNVSINGGAGNNSISLYGGAGVTINFGAGNDTVYVEEDITNFNVEEFGADDEIKLASAVDTLETIDGGIKIGSLTISGLSVSTPISAWSLDGNIATYTAGYSDGVSLSDDKKSVVYTSASGENLVEVSGVESIEGLSLDEDKKIVTVGASALGKEKVTISGDYTLALGEDVTEPEEILEGWTIENAIASYKTSGTTAGYSLENNQISYVAASGENLVEVSGVESVEGLTLDAAKKIVTVGASALGKEKVTISGDYTLALGEDVTEPEEILEGWTIENNVASYKTSGTTAGYSLEDNQISYVAASGENLVKVSGVESVEGLTLDAAKKIVTVGASALGKEIVTISGDYTLALGEDVTEPEEILEGWTIEDNVASYKTSGTTAGYSLSNNQISYVAASDSATLIELDGVASEPILENDTVKISKKNFADKEISIVKGGDYKFELNTGIYSGKTFNGSEDADIISSNGTSLKIAGGAGNDTLSGGTGKDIFIYSSGNDFITNYTAKDKISIASAYQAFEISGSDVIFNFGEDNSLTLADGAGKAININSSTNYYTVDGLLDAKQKSINLSADTETFSAAKYSKLVIIDGAAAEDEIQIVGNNKANKIYASNFGATISGGKGNDTIYGGEGTDIFIYNKGDGKDKIFNYGAGDIISLGSGAEIKDAYMKKNDAVIKIGTGSITVKNSSEITFAQGDNKTLFSGGVFIDEENSVAKVFKSFKGTIDLGKYDVTTADASESKKATTLLGGTSDDYLRGGRGKDKITGGEGSDTLWGGKGNDTLTGGDGFDTFIYKASTGNDVITDYASGELLTILNKRGGAGDFKTSTFKNNTLTLTIQGGGKVSFKNVSDTTEFNINGANYHISGNSLAEK